MLEKLKKKLKQIQCLHKWCKGLVVDIQYGKGYKYAYHCTYCDKHIERWTGNEPISGIVRDVPEILREYKKDPRYNVRPSLIVKTDDD